MSDHRLSPAEAVTLAAEALIRCNTSPANAGIVARALVAAEMDGLKGHGLVRLPIYAAQAKAGKVDGHAVPSAERRRGGVIAIDAANGFAYPAIDRALDLLPEAAREQGIALAAIRRSHHCGAAGHPVERLAEGGLVALLFANTPSAIAPWGGARPLFGTNPIAFAFPRPDAPPLVADMSLSRAARGSLLAARQRGEPIPEGWALDAEGRPTTDPDAALKGTMIPVGDAKGTLLALMVELLAAGLTGANYAAEASSFLDAEGPPPGTGQLIIAIDPAVTGGPDAIRRFGGLARMIEADPGARLPGSRRYAERARAERDGFVISEAFLAAVSDL